MIQPKKNGVNAWTLLAVTCALTVLAPLFIAGPTRLWTVLFAGFYGLLFAVGSLLMRMSKRSVLRRRFLNDARHPWDAALRLPALLMYPVIAALSAADAIVADWLPLPSWTWLVGGGLLVVAYLMMVQTLMATPPHARDLYGEAPPREGEQGAYDLLRHPVEFCAILLGFSMALFLQSGIGLIAAAAQSMLWIAYVSKEDHWRYMELEWFYEYTHKTPKKLFLFIW